MNKCGESTFEGIHGEFAVHFLRCFRAMPTTLWWFVTICYILKMAHGNSWFTELEDGDSPVRYVSLPDSHGLLLYVGAINLIWRAWSSGWSISKRRCGISISRHGCFCNWFPISQWPCNRILNWRYRFHICLAYFSGLCKEYHQKIWPEIWYVYVPPF